MRLGMAGVGIAAAIAGWSLIAGLRPVTVEAGQSPAANPAFYTQKVKPLLEDQCGKCHFGINKKGGFSMATRAATMKGGRDEGKSDVIPGDPDNSMLIKLMRHEGPPDDPRPMPPKEPKMSQADIDLVAEWIKAGAVMPNDPQPGH
jgi:mono/diheme cytochrome c family protein